jgi:hypothetical protein
MNELKGFISRPSQYEDRRDGGPRTLPNLSFSNAAHNLNTFASEDIQSNSLQQATRKKGKHFRSSAKGGGGKLQGPLIATLNQRDHGRHSRTFHTRQRLKQLCLVHCGKLTERGKPDTATRTIRSRASEGIADSVDL